MKLQSLVLCSDDKILRVLRRVLSELEIDVEHCSDPESAIHKLTRQRFEAVIVDCNREEVAAQVLRSARSAICNKRAVAVAILDSQKAVKSAFDLGAHFVLYKPISAERAKTSFRAARALMKRERRRNIRIPVEMPVNLTFHGRTEQKSVTVDLSEGGVAVQLGQRPPSSGPIRVGFTLPGVEFRVECEGEIAWENAGKQAGIRFLDPSPEIRDQIKAWLAANIPEMEKDDPPATGKLTDLSLGGCYVEIPAPFPVRTKVVLSMKVDKLQVQVDGIVRAMHPETGMGVEFTQHTAEQKDKVEKFIQALMNSDDSVPELLVDPEGLDDSSIETNQLPPADDPLLELFRTMAQLPTDAFHAELRKQRVQPAEAPSHASV